MTWQYEPADDWGGAGGQGYRSEGRGTMASPDLLVREALQNSIDAAERVGGSPRVKFTERRFRGNSKRGFLNALRIDHQFIERAVSVEASAKQGDDESRDTWESMSDDDQELRVVYVEDFGGPGLRGKHRDLPNVPSWWRTYVNYQGESDKGEGDAVPSGGSHGKGKMALASCSSVFLIVVYSEVDPEETPKSEADAALMGVLYLPKHSFGDKVWKGRAFLGEESVMPVKGDAARKIARELGFQRAPGEYGLSVAILQCRAGMEELACAVEKNWWPRLCSNEGLEVEVTDWTGTPLPLDYGTQEWIRDYVEAYRSLLGDTASPIVQAKTLKKVGTTQLGRVAVKFLDDSVGPGESDEMDAGNTNQIAYIRNLGMVVKYGEHIPGKPFRAVFLSDPGVDEILKRSEPLAHDGWEPNAQGLNDHESEIVKRILSRSGKAVRDLVAIDEAPRPTSTRGRLIDEIFAIFSQRGNAPPPPPPPSADPWHINFDDPRVEQAGDLVLRTDACIVSLKEGCEATTVRVTPTFFFNTDLDGRRERDRDAQASISSAVLIRADARIHIDARVGHSVETPIAPGETLELTIETLIDDPFASHELDLTVEQVGS